MSRFVKVIDAEIFTVSKSPQEAHNLAANDFVVKKITEYCFTL